MNQQLTPGTSKPSQVQLAGSVLVVFRVGKTVELTLPPSHIRPAYHLSNLDLDFLEMLAGANGQQLPTSFRPVQQRLLDELRARSLIVEAPDAIAPDPLAFTAAEPAAETPSQLDGKIALFRPFVLRLDSNGYSYLNHAGQALVSMTANELAAIKPFGRPRLAEDGFELQRKRLGEVALDQKEFYELVERVTKAGLFQIAENVNIIEDRAKSDNFLVRKVTDERRVIVQASLDEAAILEKERVQRTGVVRTKVIPVQTEHQPLLAHGLLMSYAMAYEGGRLEENYEFVRDWCNISVPALTGDEAPAIFLFSNYIWSHYLNMALSQRAKELNPHGICIHGGPDAPKYENDIQRYMELNPHVDIIVHGEGEATLVDLLETLKGLITEWPRDLSVLQNVDGISFRLGDAICTTGTRERFADLNVIPSPYSNGMFDNIGHLPIALQTIETNRGCPFGCTFCDWGSATLSKIRKFDLERVYADLEWCAKNKVRTVFNTDANFGVFERDVEIARKVVELKNKYGYPKIFESSYAKNQVKHLKVIIEILASGEVVSTGTLALQSVSPETLIAIERSNIKVSKYDELAVEFAKARLPLIVEMMMGLPGSTVSSFENDLQQAIDREVQARVNPTEALVNSPMNEPKYRAEHQIELLRPIEEDWFAQDEQPRPEEKTLVIATSSFSNDDYKQMSHMRQLFILAENYGVLRQVARLVRYHTGLREMVFYNQMDEHLHREPARWPTMLFTFDSLYDFMVPPGSWRLFIDEVHDYLVTMMGIPDDSALKTVLQVQHALLPGRDRSYPYTVELEHDFCAWQRSIVAAKQAGWQTDWTPNVKPLSSYGPATFTVSDPQELGTLGMGTPIEAEGDFDWEMESPISRTLRYRRSAEAEYG